MSRLEVLHLQSMFVVKSEIAESLAYSLSHLRVVGLGNECWEIDRSEPNIGVTRWPHRRVALCTGEDLGESGGSSNPSYRLTQPR